MKTISILLFSLLVPWSLNANPIKEKNNFAGIWQQTQFSPQANRTLLLPVWKVMQNDFSFCTFLIANQSGKSIITNEGHYEVTSDSTVVEHISGSITDPVLVGHQNKITYTFEGKDKIKISYRLPGASKDGHETWVRVKLEMPK